MIIFIITYSLYLCALGCFSCVSGTSSFYNIKLLATAPLRGELVIVRMLAINTTQRNAL
jgi:hypothetical protein